MTKQGMNYLGYCIYTDAYIFTNGLVTIEVKADSEPQAIERARQQFFGMA